MRSVDPIINGLWQLVDHNLTDMTVGAEDIWLLNKCAKIIPAFLDFEIKLQDIQWLVFACMHYERKKNWWFKYMVS